MADSPEEIHGAGEIRKWITEEAKKQVEPLRRAVEEVSKQNREQSAMLIMQVDRIEKVDRWTKQLWSNGSHGPPGYLEVARAEDKAKYEKLYELVTDLRAEGFREEGKKELLGEQEDNKDRRLERWKTYAYIGASLCGAWIWTMVHPIVHAFIEYLAKAIR